MDEFQDIVESTSAKSIQGAIRHVAQATSHIMFIYSGSNRRLLLELFDDKSMPLYMLCDMLNVERISSDDYEAHLQTLALRQWNEKLTTFVLDKIYSLSELHPYYVNLLCHGVWKYNKIPEMNDIFDVWENCYETHQDRLIAELEKLNPKQQDLLKILAVNPIDKPGSHTFLQVAKMPASTITQTLNALIQKDMVYRVKKLDKRLPHILIDQYRVLDPLLAHALRKYA